MSLSFSFSSLFYYEPQWCGCIHDKEEYIMKFANVVKINRRQQAARRQRALLAIVIAVIMAVAALTIVGRAWDISTQTQADYGQQAASYQAQREEVANGISR